MWLKSLARACGATFSAALLSQTAPISGGDVRKALYRVSQFLRGLGAKLSPAEVVKALRWLPPGGITLFLLMPVDAQRHSLNVLHALEMTADTDFDLAGAALLHDCGKVAAAGQISLWTRGPLVLLETFLPGLAARLARPEPAHGLRYTLWVQREHPAIGAAWAQQAGCSETTCWLIAHHQDDIATLSDVDEPRLHQLRRLQYADNMN